MFTKRNALEVIESVFSANDFEYRDEVLNFVAKETAALDHKNAKARDRAAERKAKSDELRESLAGFLSDEPITVNELVAKVNEGAEKEITSSMVIARMGQLVKDERAGRVMVKSGGRKIVAYTMA